jgi:hypothetical protein
MELLMNDNDAIYKTLSLVTAMVFMAVLWSLFRLPDDTQLLVVFTFLSTSMLSGEKSFSIRMKMTFIMALYCSLFGVITGMFQFHAFFKIPVQLLASAFTLYTIPSRQAAFTVLLTGYLSDNVSGGVTSAINRMIDILFAVLTVLVITMFTVKRRESTVFQPCQPREIAFTVTQLAIGGILGSLIQLQQGIWVILTIIFIISSSDSDSTIGQFAAERIFAVPAGIILGGLYMSTLCRLDYRFVYVFPLIAAAGFYQLYSSGNFFWFSLLFMFALTMFSDWQSGTYRNFNFSSVMIARSVATITGAILVAAGNAAVSERKSS